MNKTVKVIVSVGMVVGAIGYMAYSLSSGASTMTYDKDVSEVVAHPGKYKGKQLRVGGMVVPGSIAKRVVPPNPTEWRFRIMRHGKEMEVHFSGTPPDTFTKGTVGVTVEGRLAEGATHFEAKMIVAKCPSKYDEKEEREMKAALAEYERNKKITPAGQPVQLSTHPMVAPEAGAAGSGAQNPSSGGAVPAR
jgi:cytochrome c-type biogenesis protein CcmE